MSLYPVISAYIIPFVGLLFMLFFILYNPLFDKRQALFFLIATGINLTLLVTTMADFVFAEMDLPYFWLLRRFTSFLNFACSPIIPIILSRIFNDRRRSFFYYLPALLNSVLCFISIIIPNMVYFIDTNNKYSRGVFFFLPILVSIFYIFMLFVEPVNKHKRGKTAERMFLVAVIAVLALGMFLEIAYRYKFVMWGATAIGLILYYLFLTTHYFLSDPLTGVLNRLMYNKALSEIRGRQTCAIISIDINDFKIVNDTQGHDAGDKVLQAFATLLNDCFSPHASVYRVGGDEFVIIAMHPDYAQLDSLLEQAYRAASAQNISFAYGIIPYTPKADLDEVLTQVDKKMYCNKADYKHCKEGDPVK